MHLWLDDNKELKTPEGFQRVYTPQQAIKLLESGHQHIVHISFGGNGLPLAQFLETQCFKKRMICPTWDLHGPKGGELEATIKRARKNSGYR
jgi:hypothetical protein